MAEFVACATAASAREFRGLVARSRLYRRVILDSAPRREGRSQNHQQLHEGHQSGLPFVQALLAVEENQ